MDKVINHVCEMFHDVLYQLADKGSFKDESDVMVAKAAVSGIVKIKTLEAMEHYGGNSFRGRSYEDGMGRSYDGYSNRNSYDDGNSYRRGRGMDGRYVSRDSLRDKVEQMMSEAPNDKERNVLREILDKMQ